MSNANKEYSDRLFHFLFGREDHKDWTLSLYNAVRGSAYTDKDDIQINTIDEILYLGMHNDISFLIAGEMNLYEQQSSFNPNMPLRMLQYIAKLYAGYNKKNHQNVYGSRLLELPVPKLVVFYNGKSGKPDEMILYLRESFPAGADPDIDVRVRMININRGHSKSLLESCQPLREYSWLIDRIRVNNEEMPLVDAIDKAMDEMPEDFVIRDLLVANKAEVRKMLETEYNEEEILKIVAEDARREGEKNGKIIGEKRGTEMVLSLLKKLTPGSDEFDRALNGTQEEREALYKKYGIAEEEPRN